MDHPTVRVSPFSDTIVEPAGRLLLAFALTRAGHHRPRMATPRMKRAAMYLVVAIVVVATALGGVLVWRLARGPIAIPLLTSYLADALSSPGGPSVRIGETELAWDHPRREPVLRLRDVEISHVTGPLAVVPSLIVALSAPPLLRGKIVPAAVIADGVRLRLGLGPGGGITVGVGTRGEGTSPTSVSAVADHLLQASSAPEARTWLRTIALREGRVDVVDANGQRVWQVHEVDLVLRPDGRRGLDLQLTGVLAFGGDRVPVQIDAAWRRHPERTKVALAFRGLDPSAFGASMPGEAGPVRGILSALALPLHGRAALTLDAALAPQRGRLKLAGGRGTVRVPLPGEALAVERLRAAVGFDRDRIGIQLVSLATGRGTFSARGDVRGPGGDGTVDLTVSLAGVPVDDVGRYWPEKTAVGARQWVVANVRGGHVHSASARVTGTVGETREAPFTLAAVQGSFVFDGITARYLPAVSPVTTVAGVGTFTERGMQIRVARGTVERLEVVHATVDIPFVSAKGQSVAVDGSVRGPVATAVGLLDQEPSLALSHTLGVPARDVDGTMLARIRVAVPLQGGNDPRRLRPKVSATLHDLSVAGLLRRWNLTHGDLAIDLGGRTLAITGRGRVQGVPAAFDSKVDLDGGPRTLDVRADVDASGFAALGFGRLPAFDGPAGVRARYAAASPAAATVTIDLDLARVGIESTVPALRMRAGTRASARAVVRLSRGAISALEDVRLDLGGTHVTGTGALSDDGTRWETVNARAVLATDTAEPARVTVKVAPANGPPRLTLASDDAGRLLAALGTEPQISGGRLAFAGSWDSGAAGWPIAGRLDVGPFRLTRGHIIGRAAALVSLSGITSALSRKGGIPFDRLEADVAQRQGVLTIENARASGPTLGILARGTLDFAAGTLALEGSLVPAYYGLNQGVGRIPVVGRVLTGAEKEGFQVFDFAAKGHLASPSVTARPSSAAPGALRDLLRLIERRPGK
jgi:hypothetical protein